MKVDAQEIRRLVPHAGGMCVLESVEAWDETTLTCATRSHRRSDHPLRRAGQLAAIHLIEYGAQAAAVHGGLISRREGADSAKPGMLTALRDCKLHVERIDDIAGPLTVRARKLAASSDGSLYEFEVSAEGKKLAEGRVTIAIGAAAAALGHK